MILAHCPVKVALIVKFVLIFHLLLVSYLTNGKLHFYLTSEGAFIYFYRLIAYRGHGLVHFDPCVVYMGLCDRRLCMHRIPEIAPLLERYLQRTQVTQRQNGSFDA